jgi:hypothetical protein
LPVELKVHHHCKGGNVFLTATCICSNFSDIFDVDHFIKSVQGDVPIIKKLPEFLHDETEIITEFRSWSDVKYYEEGIASLWSRYKIIKAAKSDSRLANSNLPPDIQKLRCRVHYDALRFAPHIEAFGKVPKTLLKYLIYQHLDAWIFFWIQADLKKERL